MSGISYQLKSFSELSTVELYAILQLRAEVFVVEQHCPYQDLDGKDQASYHLLGWMDQQLVAYCRLLPKGISYPDAASIGRVVNSGVVRGQGVGKQLMEEALRECQRLFPGELITISAQHYLLRFYQELGFKERGSVYLEDDIPHIEMTTCPEIFDGRQ
jgi:ElaA protein